MEIYHVNQFNMHFYFFFTVHLIPASSTVDGEPEHPPLPQMKIYLNRLAVGLKLPGFHASYSYFADGFSPFEFKTADPFIDIHSTGITRLFRSIQAF